MIESFGVYLLKYTVLTDAWFVINKFCWDYKFQYHVQMISIWLVYFVIDGEMIIKCLLEVILQIEK